MGSPAATSVPGVFRMPTTRVARGAVSTCSNSGTTNPDASRVAVTSPRVTCAVRTWSRRTDIYRGGRNDETAVAFLSSGEMIATARLEYSDSVFGHRDGSTLIARSQPPYESFEVLAEDRSNRLDGPCLFVYDDRVFAVGRYQPRRFWPWDAIGSAFTKKRTSLFEVTRTGL